MPQSYTIQPKRPHLILSLTLDSPHFDESDADEFNIHYFYPIKNKIIYR